jgi:hypothetical protein
MNCECHRIRSAQAHLRCLEREIRPFQSSRDASAAPFCAIAQIN